MEAACSTIHLAKGVYHENPSSMRDRGHADPQPVALHASYLSPADHAVRVYFGKSPELLGPEDIRTYQLYLTNERKLASGSIHVAISALRFLYTVTLKRDWNVRDLLPLFKKPQNLPVILSHEEVVVSIWMALNDWLHFRGWRQLRWVSGIGLNRCRQLAGPKPAAEPER
jgi:hypothetical protein